jgi:hypothetical protein
MIIVRLKVNAVEDTYNIRRIMPYHTAPDPDHGGNARCRLQRIKGNILVRFEPTNLRIVYLKNYLRKLKYVYLNSWVRQ